MSIILRILLIAVVCFALYIAAVYFGQGKMLYFPRGYSTYGNVFENVELVSYKTEQGSQTSFLYPKGLDNTPSRVWWLFGGNGATAIDWEFLLENRPIPEGTVFVLVEYPGYGNCHGKPSPAAIYESVAVLHQKLVDKWGITPQELSARSRAMGHSLGSAIALHTANKFDMNEVVTVAPFTSMQDMAKRRVGWLHFLLKHHFDNRAAIEALVAKDEQPKIHIFHGSRDFLIPISMSQELVQIAGEENVTFKTVKGKGHNDILYSIRSELRAIILK